MDNKIKITNSKGEELEADVLMTFHLDNPDKEYVLYTCGEESNHNEIVYASLIEKNGDNINYQNVDEEDWIKIKDVMREIIRSGEGEK